MAGREYHVPDSEVPFYDYQVCSWLIPSFWMLPRGIDISQVTLYRDKE
jgi:hypothetical protein